MAIEVSVSGGLPVTEDQLEAILDALPDPVMILVPRRDAGGAVVDWEYRFVNETTLRLYRRSREEVVGHTQLELFPAAGDDESWRKLSAVIDSGEPVSIELWRFDPGGLERDFALSAAKFNDGLIVTAHDVTNQVRVQEELRRERDVYNATIDVAGALIAVADADGRCVRFNRQAELMTGFREAEMLGNPYRWLFLPDERAQATAMIEAASADAPVSGVSHYVTKAGPPRVMRWSSTALFDAQGRRTHVIGIGVDITAQQRAEEELMRRASELERANRELDDYVARLNRSNEDLEQFASIVSHDLREPLRGISGLLSRVAERYRGKVDEETDQFVELAIHACERMQDMIEGLLTFSRVGQGDGTITAADADQVAHETLARIRPLLDRTGAVVTVGPLPVVMADPNQLSRVFLNLVSNAVKFVAPDVTPRVTISAAAVPTGWRISVTDNGIGVPAEHRDRVFMMFKHLHPDGTYPGTGIGLAVVKRIVERHGGDVGIDDPPEGTGSTFWFTLPAEVP